MKQILSHIKSDWAKYIIELLVVVFGILLAFMLDDWNERRKSRAAEIESLENIISNIHSDMGYLKYDLDKHNKAIKSTEKIIKALTENQPYNDSLPFHFAAVNYYTVFESNKGAYESIKSVGLNSITDKSLRFLIIDLYEKWYNTLTYNQNLMTDDIHHLKRDFYQNYFDKFLVVIPVDPYYRGEMIPSDYDGLKKSKAYLYQIKSLKASHEFYASFIEFTITEIDKLETACRKEIEDLN